jgi:acyl-CoA thioesterase
MSSNVRAGSRFTRETAVTSDPAVPGRYRADFSDEWCAPEVPQGGVATAVMLRAMEAELDRPDQSLRTVTNVFAAPVRSGPAEVDVTMLRRGRSMSQMTATMRTVGESVGHTAVAVFGGPRPGFEFTDRVLPDVPPPEECPSFRDPLPDGVQSRNFRYWEHVEGRPALGHAPWDDYEPTTSQRASWMRFDDPPVLEDGTMDPFALVTLCDTQPGAVGERMGQNVPFWLPPSVDLTVHVVGVPRSEWLLSNGRAHYAGDGYASTEMELWDPEAGLIAYATQLMFFVFPEGPPTPDQVRPPG